MEGDRPWRPILNSAANEAHPALSPDGRWIAYTSNETGQNEVYVARFPDLGNKDTISIGGGRAPVWSPDGTEIFYRAPGTEMMVVPIDTEPTLTLRTASVVFDENYYSGGGRTYDLAPDGRFLMIKLSDATTEDADSALPQVILVENWFEELKRLVPTN